MVPYWVYEADGAVKTIRHVPALPLSREQFRLEDLRRTLAAYRMVFGQPRQEDLVNFLRARLTEDGSLEALLLVPDRCVAGVVGSVAIWHADRGS